MVEKFTQSTPRQIYKRQETMISRKKLFVETLIKKKITF